MAPSMPITIEFSGGAELLFDKVKKHEVTLPESPNDWTVRSLLVWIKDNLLRERPELFVQGDTVRPGILVLINDADWELLDCGFYHLNILFNIFWRPALIVLEWATRRVSEVYISLLGACFITILYLMSLIKRP